MPPDMDNMDVSGNGGPPDMNGGDHNGGGPGGMPGEETNGADEEGTEASQTVAAGTSLTEFGSDTWAALGVSVIAIIAGICVAVLYKRKWKR